MAQSAGASGIALNRELDQSVFLDIVAASLGSRTSSFETAELSDEN